ncbi:hypothetical protein [Corynebacterium auriscanis]|uniref:hypothetical protein n=1 Tax=Corynebacterium auriscanis TaxID=99807 RepID=UPI003CFA3004
MPKDAMDLWERFGEPTWDFLVDVQIPLPEYFPYDIDDANCLAALMSKYRYGIEVRGDLESPDPDDPDKPLTWTKVGKILGRPVLPFRSFRQAFGEMSEDQFKKGNNPEFSVSLAYESAVLLVLATGRIRATRILLVHMGGVRYASVQRT